MQLSLYVLAIIPITLTTSVVASRHGAKIHFHDSSELGEFDIDERSGHRPGNRNHRGRTAGHKHKNNASQFEQGIPGLYPIRGPPQAPLVLPSYAGSDGGFSSPPTPTVTATAIKQPVYYHYAGNPFLPKATTVLPPQTTTPTYLNPRRFDLLYGSNLLEEDAAKREGKAEEATEISFTDRGLFETAPHCQPGYMLVNNKCRLAV